MGEFGDFIREKRLQAKISLRGFAEKLGKAPSYISDIEKGNRRPNEKQLLDAMIEVLQLSNEDIDALYDMAAEQKENGIAQDVSEYVNQNAIAKVALRTAKAKGATEDDWKKFIQELKDK